MSGMGRTVVIRHDSPLGQWTRALYFPDAPLASCVEMLWYVAGRTAFAKDRRLPEGKTHLLFNLGDAPTLFARDARIAPRKFPTSWIAGQQHSYLETGSEGSAVLVGAQFSSDGAYRLLHVPQHELADAVVEFEALRGDRIAALRERLLHAGTPERCFAMLEHWLLDALARGAHVHAAVSEACARIQRDPADFRLPAPSRELGVSREHLIRLFRTQVGMTPKAYANVLRFDRALRCARGGSRTWSDIAHACGYYDQSHLIRDFQRYAGRAPDSLLRDGRPDDSSVVIA